MVIVGSAWGICVGSEGYVTCTPRHTDTDAFLTLAKVSPFPESLMQFINTIDFCEVFTHSVVAFLLHSAELFPFLSKRYLGAGSVELADLFDMIYSIVASISEYDIYNDDDDMVGSVAMKQTVPPVHSDLLRQAWEDVLSICIRVDRDLYHSECENNLDIIAHQFESLESSCSDSCDQHEWSGSEAVGGDVLAGEMENPNQTYPPLHGIPFCRSEPEFRFSFSWDSTC